MLSVCAQVCVHKRLLGIKYHDDITLIECRGFGLDMSALGHRFTTPCFRSAYKQKEHQNVSRRILIFPFASYCYSICNMKQSAYSQKYYAKKKHTSPNFHTSTGPINSVKFYFENEEGSSKGDIKT